MFSLSAILIVIPYFKVDVKIVLTHFVVAGRDQNKYKEATTLLQEALHIREAALGNEHPAVRGDTRDLY